MRTGNMNDRIAFVNPKANFERGRNNWDAERYDWTNTKNSYGDDGLGRFFASNFVYNFDHIGKMYGVDLKYEFYQNGERISIFTNLNN
jgi:hypothetical protein